MIHRILNVVRADGPAVRLVAPADGGAFVVHFDAKSYPSLVRMSAEMYLTIQADTIYDRMNAIPQRAGMYLTVAFA